MTTLLQGFGLGLGLIVAIGAQNAHVLRVGLGGTGVWPTVLFCLVWDAFLIALAVAGLGTLIANWDGAVQLATVCGGLVLIAYGLRQLWRARIGSSALSPSASGGRILATTVAVSVLNPHVYLDTLVLVGALAAGLEPSNRWQFGLGAVLASAFWFPALALGARLLTPILRTPRAWQVLDGVLGILLLALGVGFLRG